MRALVLSGGGSKGAAEVGTLDYLLEKNPDLDYDIYVGVSVGALNSAILAEAPLKDSFPKLKDIWLNQVKGSHSVWKHHLWYYIIAGIILISLLFLITFLSFLFSSPKLITIILFLLSIGSFYFPYRTLNNSTSIYRNDPLRNLLSSNLDIEKLKNSGKKLSIGTVSFNSGKYRTIQEINNNIIDWIMASSAFPIFFPMSYIEGEYWVDGGVVNIAPLNDAIKMGATEIDVIITSPLNSGYFYGNSILVKQAMRNLDIVSAKFLQNDISITEYYKDNLKIRIFITEKQLTSNSLNFSPSKIQNMFQEGRNLAEKLLSSLN